MRNAKEQTQRKNKNIFTLLGYLVFVNLQINLRSDTHMRITLIGSGNVATHFAAALKNAGHRIMQVYSRTMHNAALLAYHVKAEPIDDLDRIDLETDLFIISVKDDAIPSMAR